jgi:hypothetical protein
MPECSWRRDRRRFRRSKVVEFLAIGLHDLLIIGDMRAKPSRINISLLLNFVNTQSEEAPGCVPEFAA